jgi:hypothetical protein
MLRTRVISTTPFSINNEDRLFAATVQMAFSASLTIDDLSATLGKIQVLNFDFSCKRR